MFAISYCDRGQKTFRASWISDGLKVINMQSGFPLRMWLFSHSYHERGIKSNEEGSPRKI